VTISNFTCLLCCSEEEPRRLSAPHPTPPLDDGHTHHCGCTIEKNTTFAPLDSLALGVFAVVKKQNTAPSKDCAYTETATLKQLPSPLKTANKTKANSLAAITLSSLKHHTLAPCTQSAASPGCVRPLLLMHQHPRGQLCRSQLQARR